MSAVEAFLNCLPNIDLLHINQRVGAETVIQLIPHCC